MHIYFSFLQPASTFPGNPAAGPASSSQLTMGSRHPSILGGPHDSEIGGFRGHPSAAQYGGQYGSLYGQTSISAGQQVSGSFYNEYRIIGEGEHFRYNQDQVPSHLV